MGETVGACDWVRLGTVLLSMIRNTKLFLIMCSTYAAHRTLYDPAAALYELDALYDPTAHPATVLYDPATHPATELYNATEPFHAPL